MRKILMEVAGDMRYNTNDRWFDQGIFPKKYQHPFVIIRRNEYGTD